MRNLVGRGLLVLGSLALALIAAELVFRAVVPADSFFVQQPLYRIHERYIYALEPNVSTTVPAIRKEGNGQLRLETNSLGYRGPEIDPSPDRLTVAVYGDSYIFGDHTPYPETLAAQLEIRLRQRLGGRVQVLNAGIDGYGPDQSGLRIEDELPILQTDLVLLAIYTGNDFGDLLRNRIYRLENGRLAPNAYTIGDETRKAYGGTRWLERMPGVVRRSELLRAARWLWWHRSRASQELAVGHRMRDPAWVDQALHARKREYRKYVLEGDNEVVMARDSLDADLRLEPDGDPTRYKLALMEQVVLRVRSLCAEHAADLALLFIPLAEDVCEPLDSIDRERYPKYDASFAPNWLQDMAERNGIPYLDLSDPMRAGECSRFFLPDLHWSSRGQAIVANTVADWLFSEGPLSSTAAPPR